MKRNKRRRTKRLSTIVVAVIAFLFISLGAVAGVRANASNGWLDLDWTGHDKLVDSLVVVGLLTDEIDLMEDEIEALIIERDNAIDSGTALQATIDDLNQEILDLEGEISRLEGELTTANQDAEDFRTEICEEVDTIRNPVCRAKFETWCPVTP